MARLVNGDYIEASNQNGTDLTGTIGTLSVWHKPAAATGEIICKAIGLSGGTQRFAYGLDYTGGVFRFFIGNGAITVTTVSGPAPILGQWYHILGVRRITSSVQEIWINGKLAGTTTSGQQFTSIVDALRFGQAVDGDLPSNGVVRDAAIWKAELTGDEIIRLYQGVVRPGDVRPQALQAWWPLDGMDPEPDYSRFAAHGTVVGPSPRPNEQYEFPTRSVASLLAFAPVFIGAQSLLTVSRS